MRILSFVSALLLLLLLLLPPSATAQWTDQGDTAVGPGRFAVGRASSGGTLGWATAYAGFNAVRDDDTWTLYGDGAHNAGAAIYSTIGHGDLRFVIAPSTGGSDQVLTDAEMADYVRMTIEDNGRVGIGTSGPDQPLHLHGDDNESELIQFTNEDTDLGSYVGIGAGEQLLISQREGDYIEFRTDNTERIRIDRDGNLGVGTSNPSKKLEVNGKVRTREIIVEAKNWPDYVFDAGYDLRTPAELAAVIEREGHLPALPSAETVEAEGQTVGEVQRGLVQTVEELARYALRQHRRADSLATRMKTRHARQQKQIDALRRRLQRLESRMAAADENQ